MAIEVPDLTLLSDEQVQQTIDYIAQRVGEYAPTTNTRRGVVREIIVHLSGIIGASYSQVIEDKVNKSSSLLKITEDPAGADPDMVDRIISNFRVARRLGGPGSGQVTIVVSQLAPVAVPKGMEFTGGGVSFVTESAFAARTTAASVLVPTDRLLRASGDAYAFTIDVVAVDVGLAGQLKRGTVINPGSALQNFMRAYAESDFTGGADADSNELLLARLQSGMADRSSSNRITTDAMIRASFPRALATSVLGHGDPEQIRYHGALPLAAGGRVDVYVRTDALPQTLQLTKTATLIDKLTTGGVWQFSLGRDEAPGFYEVRTIVPEGEDSDLQSGYEVTELIRGLDAAADGTGLNPDVETATEAAFTRFQAATVRFLDTEVDTTNLVVNESKANYDAFVVVMPQVKELQTFLADRDRRPAAGDILAKAPVPCFLEVNLTVYKSAGQDDPNLDDIRAGLAAYVNNLGFPGRLAASALASVVHSNLLQGQTASSIDMFGRIVRPDGTVKFVRSDEVLIIPDESARMVSARTVAVYLDPDRIGVSVLTV